MPTQAGFIDKKSVSLKDVNNAQSLKSRSTKELEDLLQMCLVSDHDNDVITNMITAELISRGISEEKVAKIKDGAKDDTKGESVDKPEPLKKAFDDLIGNVEDFEKGLIDIFHYAHTHP